MKIQDLKMKLKIVTKKTFGDLSKGLIYTLGDEHVSPKYWVCEQGTYKVIARFGKYVILWRQ